MPAPFRFSRRAARASGARHARAASPRGARHRHPCASGRAGHERADAANCCTLTVLAQVRGGADERAAVVRPALLRQPSLPVRAPRVAGDAREGCGRRGALLQPRFPAPAALAMLLAALAMLLAALADATRASARSSSTSTWTLARTSPLGSRSASARASARCPASSTTAVASSSPQFAWSSSRSASQTAARR
jgi:hypothetical protein